MKWQVLSKYLPFLLDFVDLRLAGGHGVCHLFLHRADDLSLVGDQTYGPQQAGILTFRNYLT